MAKANGKSKWIKGLGAVAVVGVAVAAGLYLAGSSSGDIPPASVDFAKLGPQEYDVLYKRGEQVFRAGDCAACHSSPQTGAELAGGVPMVTPMGTLYGTNISPSKEHGIGNWSADDLYRAVATGIAPGRKVLYPAMPYASYHQITRGDSDALWAWLMKQRPVEVANKPGEMQFPFNIRPAVALWNVVNRPAAKEFDYTVNELARGRYLVDTLGHCAECHSPRTKVTFAMDTSRYLEGNTIEGSYAPALTPGALGERGWTRDDLVKFFRTGLSPQGVMTFRMASVLDHSTSHMPEADLRAMAAYLTQNQDMPGLQPKAPQTQVNVKGENLYVGLCAGCHGVQGEGQPHSSVPMSTNTTAMFPTPINLIRVIREGVEERDLAHGERMQTMPGFADKLGDEEMADLVNYMRQTWGGQPGNVTASDVAGHVRTIEHSK
ncbi:cytochrome c [Diaphorobacter ruginosibacter]|uniref:Cytochrome c n=1 Tax=Diaphorobacter ruginosibacter TaxID=1715720 RepID=A0A7G9RT38_9BURK|nr:cytochrome c [Diaphorobacter ruginosibacter]QNN58763.1 cytochrome c [Diaphorobacter ruginosibacter]